MRDVVHEPVGAPLPEEIFQLNLSYLLLAQRLIAQDAAPGGDLSGGQGAPDILVARRHGECHHGARQLPGRRPCASPPAQGGR